MKIIRNIVASFSAIDDSINNQKQSAENLSSGIHQSVKENSLYSALLRGEKTEEVQNFVAWINLINEKVENRSVNINKEGHIIGVNERKYSLNSGEKSFLGDNAILEYKIKNTKSDLSLIESIESDPNTITNGKGKIKFLNELGIEYGGLNSQVDQCNIKNYNGVKYIDLLFKYDKVKNLNIKNIDFNLIKEIKFVTDRYDSGCQALREFNYRNLEFDRLFSIDYNTTIVTLISYNYNENMSISESTMTDTIRIKYDNQTPKNNGGTVNLNING